MFGDFVAGMLRVLRRILFASRQKYFAMNVKNYFNGKELLEDSLISKDPIMLFEHWMDDARKKAEIPLSHAMTLSTVKSNGRPASRTVLLRNVSPKGFAFYTSSTSAKASELKNSPFASLVLYWLPLDRSVRIEGKVETASLEEADEYFSRSPRHTQLYSLITDTQSQPIENREVLMKRFYEAVKLYQDKPIPRPDFVQGFRVVPDSIEFYQGHESFVSDRILFSKNPESLKFCHEGENGWKYQRLGP